jgi:3',5'-cyclic AMP phosphodiesterase CpdA
MIPIIDPRKGDIEDDASSTKRRSLLALAGSLVAEISLPKLVLAWVLLIALPSFLLGMAPLVVSAWIGKVSTHASALYSGIVPVVLLSTLAVLAWLGGGPAFRLVENSFWSLNALGVQPAYAVCREVLRHVLEKLLPPDVAMARRNMVRRAGAAMSGLLIGAVAFVLAATAWPVSRWVGSIADLASPHLLVPIALANAVVIIGTYFAFAALAWGVADAAMAQPGDLSSFATPSESHRTWRVAHLSDIHVVGERYGFRVESGRSGPRGNQRLAQALAKLDAIHALNPLDLILITGDVTDAGRSAEWAQFFDALTQYPRIARLVLALPGNHDLNVVDRANPARLDLPMSPKKRLRQMRTVSALSAIQGASVHVVDRKTGRLGQTLQQALEPHQAEMATFANEGSIGLSISLAQLWTMMFPMVKPPDTEDGLGIIILNSNAETHFSFTNALGMVSAEQARAIDAVTERYARACWIVALHHHLVEYPKPVKALSERIGTALINGSWFMRRLGRLADHAVVMHGHRHVDWIGQCGGLLIVSAPSPVMEATDDYDTYFYVHTLAMGTEHKLILLAPERIDLPGLINKPPVDSERPEAIKSISRRPPA